MSQKQSTGNISKGWWLALVIAVVFPFVSANEYYLSVAILALIYAIAALGLNLLTGYTGQFNLAHGGFMAIGAYAVGILTVDYEWSFWSAFIVAVMVTMAIGLLVGWISLRLKGHFFSIFTLCVSYIIFLLIEKWDSLTHGVVGIMNVPAPELGNLDFYSESTQYYLVLSCLVIGVWLMHRLTRSLVGRSFIAIKNSDSLAEALGINLMRTKVLSFVISVAYAAVAGGLYAGYVRFLGPDMAYVSTTFNIVMFVLVGGLGTLAGPIIGALLLSSLTQSLQFLADYRMLVFGPLLIVVLIFVPSGIVGLWRKLTQKKAAE
ncbi:MAG: branched-chain amino acid ABC transporter permease [Pelistega sp.]|nr:branched-chain amino acid ABC transporter permease [Pelistega sp.]